MFGYAESIVNQWRTGSHRSRTMNVIIGMFFCIRIRGLSQIVFPTVSVILTLRGGSVGVTLIFYLKHTLTFVIILQPSDVNFNHFQLHAQKLTLKFLARFHNNCTHVSEG